MTFLRYNITTETFRQMAEAMNLPRHIRYGDSAKMRIIDECLDLRGFSMEGRKLDVYIRRGGSVYYLHHPILSLHKRPMIIVPGEEMRLPLEEDLVDLIIKGAIEALFVTFD